MVELLELKDYFFLAFFGVALYLHGRTRWKDGMREGIDAGVKGTIDSLIQDGLIEEAPDGEIIPKIPK